MLENLNKKSEKCAPLRRIPATRDFPIACGNNFPTISRMECLRLLSSSENINSTDECFSRESTQSEEMLEDDCREISKNVQDGHWSQLNKRKVHEEFEDASPIACGDDFPIISRMECLRLLSSSENINSTDECFSRESTQSEEMLEDDCREISKNVQDGHWSQLNKRKVHEEFEDASPIACGDDFPIISRMECSRMQVHEEFEDAGPASNCSEGNKSCVLAPFSGERVIVQALMATQNCPWRNAAKRFVKPQELMAAPKSTQRRQAKQVVKSEGDKSIVLVSSERIIIQALMAAPYCPWRSQSKRFVKSQGLMTAPNDPLRGQEKQFGKFQREEKSIVLAPSFSERVIVQGLMAAPNCPWRQARRDNKSTAHGITKSKVSKEAISLYFRE